MGHFLIIPKPEGFFSGLHSSINHHVTWATALHRWPCRWSWIFGWTKNSQESRAIGNGHYYYYYYSIVANLCSIVQMLIFCAHPWKQQNDIGKSPCSINNASSFMMDRWIFHCHVSFRGSIWPQKTKELCGPQVSCKVCQVQRRKVHSF